MMEKIKNIIKEKLDLPISSILQVSFLGGMTNKNYIVSTQQDSYVVRIPGAMTESLIIRDNEAVNSIAMSKAGFNVETCFFDAKSGIKITQYLSESCTLDHQNVKTFSNLKLIAEKLYLLHQSPIKLANRFNVFEEFDKYINLLKNKDAFYQYSENMPELLAFFQMIKTDFSYNQSFLAVCHNDLVPENILLKGEQVYFIDWEYSGMNDPMFDLAAFFLEAKLNKAEQDFFLQCYFKKQEDIEEALMKIAFYQFTQDVLWFVWTLVKEENGEFFEGYGKNRIERAIAFMKTWKAQEV
ncbi:choline kinase family protein [Pasteurella oralis]|uniref:choline kinase family protein n=1 Tax=Pasteurella oralis TaxID=1071947 RepID=UPI001FEC9154|nr:choline kinase family protein [Pasteurella oralis]